MTKRNYSQIIVLLDRSGSMETLKKDMESGFDGFVKDQQKVPGECDLTLVQFDSWGGIEWVYENKPLAEVPPLDLQPRGGTPLLDALGETIDRVGKTLRDRPEQDRPEHVIFMVITDGEENSSRVERLETVGARIKRQREQYKWQFVFLGANFDVFADAGKLNIPLAAAAAYSPDSAGVQAAYYSSSEAIGDVRRGLSSTMAFTEAQRAKMKGESEAE